MADEAPVSAQASSPDPVGTRIGNASSIYDLGARVFDKVADVWKQGSESREKKEEAELVLQELKDGLGEWETEAQDEKGRWRQPFLGNDAYERHFVKCDGRLQPSGTSTATFGWAQLLFALNIRPKGKGEKGIITWRKLPRGMNPAKTGTLLLAVNGAILCHIINFYQLYRSGKRVPHIYEFPFGDLTLEDEEKHIYTFAGHSDADLLAEKLPFRYSMQDVMGTREDHLRFEADFLDIQYQYAINNGISGLKAELVRSKPGEKPKPLQMRADSLIEAMRLIRKLEWEKPCIMSPEWAEDASRIKRRMTSETEEFLIQNVINCLLKKPDVVESLKEQARKPELWQEEVKSSVKALCMPQGVSFKFVWNDPTMLPSANAFPLDITVKEQLPWILQESRTWKTPSLEDISPASLLEILEMPHEIINAPVIVLRGIPKEWSFVAEISG